MGCIIKGVASYRLWPKAGSTNNQDGTVVSWMTGEPRIFSHDAATAYARLSQLHGAEIVRVP